MTRLVTYRPDHDTSNCGINGQRDRSPYLKTHCIARVRIGYIGVTHEVKNKTSHDWCEDDNDNKVCRNKLHDGVIYGTICDSGLAYRHNAP